MMSFGVENVRRDPVTNLWHRTAWFIELSSGHIVKLLSVSRVLER
jgi:hypothetical protein